MTLLRLLGPPAAATLLITGGAIRVAQAGAEGGGWALLSLGALMMGAWLTLLIVDRDKDE
jgi:hypothetical protein